ncbi:unnamed protein product [Closterium sp. NIES-54]
MGRHDMSITTREWQQRNISKGQQARANQLSPLSLAQQWWHGTDYSLSVASPFRFSFLLPSLIYIQMRYFSAVPLLFGTCLNPSRLLLWNGLLNPSQWFLHPPLFLLHHTFMDRPVRRRLRFLEGRGQLVTSSSLSVKYSRSSSVRNSRWKMKTYARHSPHTPLCLSLPTPSPHTPLPDPLPMGPTHLNNHLRRV